MCGQPSSSPSHLPPPAGLGLGSAAPHFQGPRMAPPISLTIASSPTEAPAHAGASDSEDSLWLGLPVCLQHHHGQHTQQGGRRAGGRQLPPFFQPFAPGCPPLETGAD